MKGKTLGKSALLHRFRVEVCALQCPDFEALDWTSLSIGWFLANGASPKEAQDLAREVRYKHGYWA